MRKSTPQIDLFLLLRDAAITTVDEWASKHACRSATSSEFASAPVAHPRYALALYRTLYYLLWNIPGVSIDKQLKAGFGPDLLQRELYESSMNIS